MGVHYHVRGVRQYLDGHSLRQSSHDQTSQWPYHSISETARGYLLSCHYFRRQQGPNYCHGHHCHDAVNCPVLPTSWRDNKQVSYVHIWLPVPETRWYVSTLTRCGVVCTSHTHSYTGCGTVPATQSWLEIRPFGRAKLILDGEKLKRKKTLHNAHSVHAWAHMFTWIFWLVKFDLTWR